MSIQSEIERIEANVNNSLAAINNKGVSIPEGANSNNLPELIAQIPTGEEDVQEELAALQSQIEANTSAIAGINTDLLSLLTNYVLPQKTDLNDMSEATRTRSISFAYYVLNATNSPDSGGYGIVITYYVSNTTNGQIAFDVNKSALYIRKNSGAWTKI